METVNIATNDFVTCGYAVVSDSEGASVLEWTEDMSPIVSVQESRAGAIGSSASAGVYELSDLVAGVDCCVVGGEDADIARIVIETYEGIASRVSGVGARCCWAW